MSNSKKKLRDLLYFDEGKASSLLSQLEQGLLKQAVESEETTGKKAGGLKLGIGVIEGNLGGESAGRSGTELTKVRFHDMLVDLENQLFVEGYALDLNSVATTHSMSPPEMREMLVGSSYLRVEGNAVINDFARLQDFAKDFKTIVELQNRSGRFNIEQTTEFQVLSSQIEAARAGLKSVSDRNEKARRKQLLDELQKSLDEFLSRATTLTAPPDWMLEGVMDWIRIFNSNQIHLRIRPFADSSFEVVANLKRNGFVDPDIGNLIFSYGSRPNVLLTVFGLITSIPPTTEKPVGAVASTKVAQSSNLVNPLHTAFRGVFDSMSEFEAFSGFTDFPNIKVHPIAVYHQIKPRMHGAMTAEVGS